MLCDHNFPKREIPILGKYEGDMERIIAVCLFLFVLAAVQVEFLGPVEPGEGFLRAITLGIAGGIAAALLRLSGGRTRPD